MDLIKIKNTEIVENLVIYHLENGTSVVYTLKEVDLLRIGEPVKNYGLDYTLYEPVFNEKEFTDDETILMGFVRGWF